MTPAVVAKSADRVSQTPRPLGASSAPAARASKPPPESAAAGDRASQAPQRRSLAPAEPLSRASKPPQDASATPLPSSTAQRASTAPSAPAARVSRPPRASGAPDSIATATRHASELADEPPESAAKTVASGVAARKQAASASDAVTARASAAGPSPTPEPVSTEAAQASPDESSAVDVSVDLDDSPEGSATAVTPDIDSPIAVPIEFSSAPPPAQPLLKRRAALLGGVGAILVIGVLAMTMGSRKTAPERRGTVPASAERMSDRMEPAPSGATPSAATPPAAPPPQSAQPTTAEASPSSPEPAASAEEEEVKVTINIKPDGAVVLRKGKVIGRTPFILKQPRGEKRSYEVGKPGYATRRLVVNGTERTIGFELGIDTPHPDSL